MAKLTGSAARAAPPRPTALADELTVVRYRTGDEGLRHGVLLPGTPPRVVYLAGHGVALRRLGRDDLARCTACPDYPPRRAMRKLLRAGRSLGISQRAARALRETLRPAKAAG